MNPWRSTLAGLVLAACGAGAACGGDEPVKPENDVSLGVGREVPLENPCQWLTVDEAAQAMQRAGVDLGSSGLFTATKPTGMGDNGADCWYSPRTGVTGRLSVALLGTPKAASNWRTRMKDVAAHGGREEDGETTQLFSRVANAPTLQNLHQTANAASCDAFALTGDSAVVSVALGVGGASDGEALCAEVKDLIETVIGRLPEAEEAHPPM